MCKIYTYILTVPAPGSVILHGNTAMLPLWASTSPIGPSGTSSFLLSAAFNGAITLLALEFCWCLAWLTANINYNNAFWRCLLKETISFDLQQHLRATYRIKTQINTIENFFHDMKTWQFFSFYLKILGKVCKVEAKNPSNNLIWYNYGNCRKSPRRCVYT